MKKIFLTILFFAFITTAVFSNQIISDIGYPNGNQDEYSKELCKLDLYIPNNAKDLPVLIWFHGGGISNGNKKDIPAELKSLNNCILVSVNYRLSPKINAVLAIDDTACAIAWVFQNIESYGGNKNKIFISGHSAGGYLAGMVGFAPKYLKKHNIKNTDIAGMILLSGQATTHFQVRKDSGDKTNMFAPKIDEFAILGNVENKISPLCIIVGDRRIEWKERVEENFLLASAISTLKTGHVEIYELQGLNHGTVVNAFKPIALEFIKKILKSQK